MLFLEREEDKLLKSYVKRLLLCDREAVVKVAKEVIDKEVDTVRVIEEGLSKGTVVVGDRFDKLEIFLSELVMAAETMKAGLDILFPNTPKGEISNLENLLNNYKML